MLYAGCKLDHGLIDSQHQLLFSLIADLKSKVQEDLGQSVLDDFLECLYSYAALHFATEDRLMSETDYKDMAKHRREHEVLLAAIRRLDHGIQSGIAATTPKDVLRFVESWESDHIPNADRRLVEHLAKRRNEKARPTKRLLGRRK